ncbi:MAG TPA: SPOR domain-containing protein [Gammaproteobacteria bacterium]
MDLRLKHRLVGAIVLIAIGVIFIPLLLDGRPPAPEALRLAPLPAAPQAGYVPRRIDLAAPAASVPPAPPAPPATTTGTPAEEAPAVPGEPLAWVIQVGSFSQAENARALRDELRQRGFPAFTEELPAVAGQVAIRVRIGPELERGRLERQLAELHKDAQFANALILQHR